MQYKQNDIEYCINSITKIQHLLNYENQSLDSKLEEVKRWFEYINTMYQEVEHSLKNRLGEYFTSVDIGVAKPQSTFVSGTSGTSVNTNHFKTYKHTSVRDGKSIASYFKNGACVGASATYTAYSIQSKHVGKYGGSSARIDIANVKVNADIGAGVYSDGKLSPHIRAELGGRASLIDSEVRASVGSSRFGATTNLGVSIGGVQGEAKAKIDSNGVTIKAGASAYAAKFSGSVGLRIFGYHIELEVGAIIGGVGASAEYSQSSNEVEVGVEGSLIGGLGIKIRVGKGD